MAKVAPSSVEPVGIGRRARVIRCHLGLSLEVVAGLAGMDERHLARVETGKRHVDRMGQVEDLAAALGCSVVDLTGQPYLPADRASADTLAVVPGIREALCDTTVDDPPGGAARPVGELAEHVRRAAEHLDQDRYPRAGGELGALLSELHVRAGAGDDAVRGAALAALMTACRVAAAITGMIGYHDLALIAARRGLDAADRLGDPVVAASARLGWARTWLAVGARPQAEAANERALADLGAPSAPEAVGLLGRHHLLAARLAARAGRADAADH
ncbi:MAG TPA: helix-turn-helix transcriptional regulator, partial [Pseudonocardiaceae bacterium]